MCISKQCLCRKQMELIACLKGCLGRCSAETLLHTYKTFIGPITKYCYIPLEFRTKTTCFDSLPLEHLVFVRCFPSTLYSAVIESTIWQIYHHNLLIRLLSSGYLTNHYKFANFLVLGKQPVLIRFIKKREKRCT